MTLLNNSISSASSATIASNWPTIPTVSETIDKPKRNTKQAVQLDTLHVPRASELVAEKLRSLIVMGEVTAGTSLPTEKELVKQLGVSRATLREALRLLQAEGLIATKQGPKGGIIVQKPGSAHLTRSLSLLLQLEDTPFQMLLEARCLLEPLCAKLAAERATVEEVAQLQALAGKVKESVGDLEAYVQAQLDFHLTVIAYAHNDVLRLYTISVGELISTQTANVGLSERQQWAGVKAAEAIMSAIVNRNSALAARLTETHLHRFESILREKLGLRKQGVQVKI